MVSPEHRNSSISTRHGPIASCPLDDEVAHGPALVGAHLEVVVDRRHLAVEGEAEPGLCGRAGRDVVQEVDKAQPEALERLVPLPVPVGVRHQPHLAAVLLVHRLPPRVDPVSAAMLSERARSRSPELAR